jgi:hypothetical protein
MIQTVTIDIINENAMKLLQDLELLQLIRVHKEKDISEKINWSSKYKGSVSKQSLSDIDDQLNQLRNQWQ